MTGAIIGLSGGLLIIIFFWLMKSFDKTTIYGLILCGIAFLYVGFVWTSLSDLVANSVQAIGFVFLAYYGMKKQSWLLAAGYILHGCWDILYPFWRDPGLIPPQYDIFCLTIDVVTGLYILAFPRQFSNQNQTLYKTNPL
jgi:hypothetical protein